VNGVRCVLGVMLCMMFRMLFRILDFVEDKGRGAGLMCYVMKLLCSVSCASCAGGRE
jgi:hypothetical protein